MTTPSRRLLELFTKEDTPERQTPLPPTRTSEKQSAGEALRGEVSNTPLRFRHSLHDVKTPKLTQGFRASDFGGNRSVNTLRLGMRGDFDKREIETTMESIGGPQFETIKEERSSLHLDAEIDPPALPLLEEEEEEGDLIQRSPRSRIPDGQVEETDVEREAERGEFEEWIHQQAAKFGRTYDEMMKEMEEEAVAFAHQTKRQREMMKEVEIEERRKFLDDIGMCMPCEGSPSPVPSCVHDSGSCDSTDCPVSPATIRSLGSLPPFDFPEEPDFIFHDLENSENGEYD